MQNMQNMQNITWSLGTFVFLQHRNTLVVCICRLARILFIWELIFVRKLEAFQNHKLELEYNVHYAEYAEYVKCTTYNKYDEYDEYA